MSAVAIPVDLPHGEIGELADKLAARRRERVAEQERERRADPFAYRRKQKHTNRATAAMFRKFCARTGVGIPAKPKSDPPTPVRHLTRGAAAPRPRERRDGSRRHSTRGSTDDDSGGSEPPGHLRLRLCLGCGEPLPSILADGKSTKCSIRTCSDRCRKQWSRIWSQWGDDRDQAAAERLRHLQHQFQEAVPVVAAGSCRCDRPMFDPEVWWCVKCGHDLDVPFYRRVRARLDYRERFRAERTERRASRRRVAVVR